MLPLREEFETQPSCIAVFVFISWTGLLSLFYFPPPFLFEVPDNDPMPFWHNFGPLFVFGMLTYASFFRAWMTDAGGVPDAWSIEAVEADLVAGGVDKTRVCNKCNVYKPERAHHCKRCDRCILKMDHHCPWTSNCVGYHNYKFFFLLLFWGTVAMLWFVYMFASRAWHSFWNDSGDDKHWTLIMTVSANVAVIGYLGNLLVQHVFLIAANKSTIEWQANRHAPILFSEYSFGLFNNIKAALGSNPLMWLLPIGSSFPGEGLRFKKATPLRD